MKTLLLSFLTVALMSFAPFTGGAEPHDFVPQPPQEDMVVLLVEDADSPFDRTVFVFPKATELTVDQLDGVYGAKIVSGEDVKVYKGRFSLLVAPPYENGDLTLQIDGGKVSVYTSRTAAEAAGVL